MYKLQIDTVTGQESDFVQKITGDGSFVFVNKATDQAYLAWLAEGHEPLPPDDQTGQNTPIQE
jgi:hypothetical protein